MNGKKVLNSFDFHDDRVFDQEVHTISKVDRNAIISNGKGLFDLKSNTESFQFVRQTDAIGLLKQTRSQPRVDRVGGTKDAVRSLSVNEMKTVSSVRFRVLRGSAFVTQREGRS